MKQQTKLSEEQQQQQHAAELQTQKQSAREFANAEEMLRYDAAHTAVPPDIARRLQKSTGGPTEPKTSWWKRLFGGTHP
jgi:type II secretory pathway pseudopilin PulG